MRRVWAWMAVNFGKHAGIVGVIGLAITLVLGLGITKLDFATGQDSYLNKDEQVYKDSVAYQDLFGGQAMVTPVHMDEGQTVTELFTPENIEHLASRSRRSCADGERRPRASSPRSPRSSSPRHRRWPSPTRRRPAESVAGQALLGATRPRARPRGPGRSASRTPASPSQRHERRPGRAARSTTPSGSTSCSTTTRARSASRCGRSSPTSDHAQMVVRLAGNPSIEDEGAAATTSSDVTDRPRVRGRRRSPPPARRCCSRTSTTTYGRHADARRASPSRSWS